MLYLRKLLKLPSPADLGWSEYNALPSREWTPDCEGPTWEDWHVEVKKLHPIKYFIAETMGDFLRYKIWLRFTRPFTKAHYWFVSHFIPSRRYHMLDLRQEGGYRYGWNDVPEKMLYAMFNLLGEYLNKEEPHDLTQWHTREEINADAGLKAQQDAIDEARAIYEWWIVGRKTEQHNHDQMQHLWWSAKKDNHPLQEEYWKKLRQMDDDMETKTDEMIARLMKIRRTLWT